MTIQWRWGWVCLCLGLLWGCSREVKPKEAVAGNEPGPDAVDEGPDETTVALEQKLGEKKRRPSRPKTTAVVPAARQLGPDEQYCFGCDQKAWVGCGAPGCRNGWVDCPGPCLTRNEGTWVPDPKPGAPPGSMAFVLKFPGVKSAWTVSEYHAGEIWTLKNGQLVSLGNCPTCGGRRQLPCKSCAGTGLRPCPVCEGKTVLPSSWKPTDNPWFNRQPDVVRLKDGRVFLGRDAGGDDVIVMFRTQHGETLSVPRSEVVQWPKVQ